MIPLSRIRYRYFAIEQVDEQGGRISPRFIILDGSISNGNGFFRMAVEFRMTKSLSLQVSDSDTGWWFSPEGISATYEKTRSQFWTTFHVEYLWNALQ